jgi:hypothetical protein
MLEKKTRVGFLVDGLTVSHQVAELINFVQEDQSFCDPVIFITDHGVKTYGFVYKMRLAARSGLLSLVNALLLSVFSKLIRAIELPLVRKQFPNYQRSIDISPLTEIKRVYLSSVWSKNHISVSFSDKDILKVRETGVHCLIRCGSGVLQGEILNATKYGVLSFHHGDNRVNRGGPSGFWEVLNKESSSGFIIQRLTKELDGGEVVFRGNMMTANLWLMNNAQLIEKSNIFMKKVLKNIANDQKLESSEKICLHDRPLLKISSWTVMFKYFFYISIPKIIDALASRFFGHKITRWSIAFAKHNNFSKSLWRFTEVENPKGRYFADPFVFNYRGDTFLFAEDYSQHNSKGSISAMQVIGNTVEHIGVVLEEDFHLSFPFVFEAYDEIYMVPESSQAREIRLYKCIDFPRTWELEHVMMENVSAADTMIFKQDNLWFMLTNICSANIGDHQSELHIFYSENLKTRNWLPIKSGNPVLFDSQKARNGGLVQHKGSYYRINQVQDMSHYGKAFEIKKILDINENTYQEEKVMKITPSFKKDIISTHHFHADETFAVVDFGRKERLK